MGGGAERRELRNQMRTSHPGLLICVPLKCSREVKSEPGRVHVAQFVFSPFPKVPDFHGGVILQRQVFSSTKLGRREP